MNSIKILCTFLNLKTSSIISCTYWKAVSTRTLVEQLNKIELKLKSTKINYPRTSFKNHFKKASHASQSLIQPTDSHSQKPPSFENTPKPKGKSTHTMFSLNLHNSIIPSISPWPKLITSEPKHKTEKALTEKLVWCKSTHVNLISNR